MELFLIYLWLKLDSVIGILFFASFVGCLIFGVMWIPRLIEGLENKNLAKWHTRLTILSPLLAVLATIIPSSKDTAILVGASIALDVAKSPEGEKVGKLIRQKANEFLDKQLEEATKK